MDKLEIINSGMENIYKFADDFSETEAIGILVGTLVVYCLRHKLSIEHVINTIKYSYSQTVVDCCIVKKKGGDTD